MELKKRHVSIIFYHIFLWLYKTGIRLITPWNRKAQLWVAGRKDIFRKMEEKMGPGSAMGPEQKKALDLKLHQLVCDKTLKLKDAQDAIKKDWVKAYGQYVTGAK